MPDVAGFATAEAAAPMIASGDWLFVKYVLFGVFGSAGLLVCAIAVVANFAGITLPHEDDADPPVTQELD